MVVVVADVLLLLLLLLVLLVLGDDGAVDGNEGDEVVGSSAGIFISADSWESDRRKR